MKKFHCWRSIVILTALIAVFVSIPAHAADNMTTTERFSGLFLSETRLGARNLWYVDPMTKKRFAIPSADRFSRLLSSRGRGVTKKTLQTIVSSANSLSEIIKRYTGSILLVVDDSGAAWYVDPLTGVPVRLQNGSEGFAVVNDLSLGVTSQQLSVIPITDTLGFTQSTPSRDSDPAGTDMAQYNDVFSKLTTRHYNQTTFTPQQIFYGSLKGMAESTNDPYTEFYPPIQNDERREFFQGNRQISGIGAVIDNRENTIIVVSVISDAPAKKAGLRSGDRIVAVDGRSTDGLSSTQAASFIMGPEGSEVRLTIVRPAVSTREFDMTITRALVHLADVESEKLNDSIAYIKVHLFGFDAPKLFARAVASTVTSSTRGIVLDLRNNPGGVTDAASNIASYWLKDGDIVYTEKRLDSEHSYKVSGIGSLRGYPTLVLTNGESASASEIVAAALRDNSQASTVGSKTFGKGTGQTIADYTDGSSLKYTTFEWLTPKGINVTGVGIAPDYPVAEGLYDDAQLAYALSLLK